MLLQNKDENTVLSTAGVRRTKEVFVLWYNEGQKSLVATKGHDLGFLSMDEINSRTSGDTSRACVEHYLLILWLTIALETVEPSRKNIYVYKLLTKKIADSLQSVYQQHFGSGAFS